MSHLMVDPVAVVSFPDSARSATPLATSEFDGYIGAFSSIEKLDAALIVAGDTQAYLDTLSINDKIYRLRVFLDEETVTATQLTDVSLVGRTSPDPITDTVDPVAEVEPWGTVWVNTATPEVFQSEGDGTWVSKWSGV